MLENRVLTTFVYPILDILMWTTGFAHMLDNCIGWMEELLTGTRVDGLGNADNANHADVDKVIAAEDPKCYVYVGWLQIVCVVSTTGVDFVADSCI